MSEAPDRIWAEPWYHTDPATRRWNDEDWASLGAKAINHTQASLGAHVVDRTRAELARLREENERLCSLLARYSMNVGECEGSFFTAEWNCREITEEEGREIDAIREAHYAALAAQGET